LFVCTETFAARGMQIAQMFTGVSILLRAEAHDPAVEATVLGGGGVAGPVHATRERVGHDRVVVVGDVGVALGVEHLHAAGHGDVLLRPLLGVRAGDRGNGAGAGRRVVRDPVDGAGGAGLIGVGQRLVEVRAEVHAVHRAVLDVVAGDHARGGRGRSRRQGERGARDADGEDA
jgi:hypothetical protein